MECWVQDGMEGGKGGLGGVETVSDVLVNVS